MHPVKSGLVSWWQHFFYYGLRPSRIIWLVKKVQEKNQVTFKYVVSSRLIFADMPK